jgi:hypothetical protein
VFENRVLRRIFGPKRDGVMGGTLLINSERCSTYSSSHTTAHYCTLLHTTARYCTLLHTTACHCTFTSLTFVDFSSAC